MVVILDNSCHVLMQPLFPFSVDKCFSVLNSGNYLDVYLGKGIRHNIKGYGLSIWFLCKCLKEGQMLLSRERFYKSVLPLRGKMGRGHSAATDL